MLEIISMSGSTYEEEIVQINDVLLVIGLKSISLSTNTRCVFPLVVYFQTDYFLSDFQNLQYIAVCFFPTVCSMEGIFPFAH